MHPWLLLTRGAPGVGKSTFIREHNLSALAVNPDQIRDELGGLYHDSSGDVQRGAVSEEEVWRQVECDVLDRMRDKQHIISDATFQRARDFDMPRRLLKQHRYRPAVLDFTMVPVEVALKRNLNRTGYARVPEFVIRRAYDRFRSNILPSKLTVIEFESFARHPVYHEIGARFP